MNKVNELQEQTSIQEYYAVAITEHAVKMEKTIFMETKRFKILFDRSLAT